MPTAAPTAEPRMAVVYDLDDYRARRAVAVVEPPVEPAHAATTVAQAVTGLLAVPGTVLSALRVLRG